MKEVFEKVLNKCKKSILFYVFVYILIFVISKVVLNLFGLEYRRYISFIWLIVIFIGIVVGISQILINSKSKVLKICIIIGNIFVTGIIVVVSPIILLLIAFIPKEHIVEKDNIKYVAYVYSLTDTRVEYYDYVNFFLRGNTVKIEDFYNNIGRDVLSEDASGLFKPTYTTYYDKEGNIINNYLNEETEKIEEVEEFNETIYSSDQLKKYEKDFNTFEINGFIVSTNTYTKPSEIDLEDVFYSGAGFNNHVSKEEIEEYKKLAKYHETDIVKITTEQAEKLYYYNTGEKLENLKERLKNWIYIEKYDAYYKEVSDTNFEKVSCIKGVMDEKNKIMKIQLSNNRTISVRIDYEKGTHYIISNKSTI